MGRALQQWLNTHELPAIAAAVLGIVLALSVLIVVGGYLIVTP
jgi:redox-regulated HSP33 family molecular chaperone